MIHWAAHIHHVGMTGIVCRICAEVHEHNTTDRKDDPPFVVICSVRQGTPYIFAIQHKREPKQRSWEQNQIKINQLLVSTKTSMLQALYYLHSLAASTTVLVEITTVWGMSMAYRIYIILFHCSSLTNVWSCFWPKTIILHPQNIISSDSDKRSFYVWISSCQGITSPSLTTFFRPTKPNTSGAFCSGASSLVPEGMLQKRDEPCSYFTSVMPVVSKRRTYC